MRRLGECITTHQGLMRTSIPGTPSGSPDTGLENGNHAGSGADGSQRCTDAGPIGPHRRITHAPASAGDASSSIAAPSEALALARQVLLRLGRQEAPATPGGAEPLAPSCYRCGSQLASSDELLCPACYTSRRPEGPGVVVRIDEARRRRTEARLGTSRCSTCRGSWWRVHSTGDAECEPCRDGRRPPLTTAPASRTTASGRKEAR